MKNKKCPFLTSILGLTLAFTITVKADGGTTPPPQGGDTPIANRDGESPQGGDTPIANRTSSSNNSNATYYAPLTVYAKEAFLKLLSFLP